MPIKKIAVQSTEITHKGLVVIFNQMFPTIAVRRWWTKGPNAIRIRTDRGADRDLMFKYHSESRWMLVSAELIEKTPKHSK